MIRVTLILVGHKKIVMEILEILKNSGKNSKLLNLKKNE